MLKKVIDIIKNNKTFLISAHINVEGDALGSALAMYGLLKVLKKKAVIYNEDKTPSIYSFIPYVDNIKNEMKGEKFDVAIVLDCSDASRAGKVKDYLSNAKCIVNIDHHISNTYFGDVNWVNPKASSASEMMYTICRKFDVMNNKIALCMYVGMFTDTGNFTYANSTKNVHKIVAALLDYRVHPEKVYEKLHSCCTGADIRFIGKILTSIKVDSKTKIAWIIMKHWRDLGFDLTEIVFSSMKLLEDIEVFILFKKVEARKTRVNFRSRSKVDVNRIAKFFGGGGHNRASGTTIEDNLDSTEKKVISFVKRYTNGRSSRK